MTEHVVAPLAADLLERIATCPLCGADSFEELSVPNLISRDADQTQRLRSLTDSEFFLEQQLAVCARCDHLFQRIRPTRAGLDRLYDNFAATLSKVTPSPEIAIEYVLSHNSKEYVLDVAKTLRFLDQHRLLEGVETMLEMRTYGGGLPAILRERGVDYCEAAYLQDFDAHVARRLYGLDHLTPMSFSGGFEEVELGRDRYDLVVLYEGLTHSRDPIAVLDWLDERLAEGGTAVLFREPNTPAYRPLFPLDVVFNNFHLHLFTRATILRLVETHGRFRARLYEETHASFAEPLYANVVLRRDGDGDRAAGERAYGADFYRSWIVRDRSRVRRRAERSAAVGKRRARTVLGRIRQRLRRA